MPKIVHPLFICYTIFWSLTNCVSKQSQWYPKYHLAPIKGWFGYPTGLVHFEEYFHIFYQLNPEYAAPGIMRLGHAKSRDMVRWKHLPIALSPSLPDDIFGTLSGSAVVVDNNLTLFYTGVGVQDSHQKQMLATSERGISFQKLGVIIENKEDDFNFRNPKAWKQDDKWFAVLGYETKDNYGQILLYQSNDFFKWEYKGILAKSDDSLGYLWESPDLFTLDNQQILMISSQGIEQDKQNYPNLYQAGYFVGSWTPGEPFKIDKEFTLIDHGHDFYAAQTFLAPDGRRILLAWMGMWGDVAPKKHIGWVNMLTLPREVTLSKEGKLQTKPIKELKSLRKGKPVDIRSKLLKKGDVIMVDDKVFNKEIELEFDMTSSDATCFGVHLGKLNNEEGVKTFVNRSVNRLMLKRYYPKYNVPASHRSVPLDMTQPSLRLKIFVDSSSIEIFVNDGQAVMTSRIYPDGEDRHVHAYALEGSAMLSSFNSWELEI